MKSRRRREILGLIETGALRTQAELAKALAGRGISVSQGTLSRDLRELGVVKTAGGYATAAAAVPQDEGAVQSMLVRLVRQFLLGVKTAQNMVVLRTEPGGANALAQGLDAASLPDVIGTVAGDDTIFVATSDRAGAERVRETLEAL